MGGNINFKSTLIVTFAIATRAINKLTSIGALCQSTGK